MTLIELKRWSLEGLVQSMRLKRQQSKLTAVEVCTIPPSSIENGQVVSAHRPVQHPWLSNEHVTRRSKCPVHNAASAAPFPEYLLDEQQQTLVMHESKHTKHVPVSFPSIVTNSNSDYTHSDDGSGTPSL